MPSAWSKPQRTPCATRCGCERRLGRRHRGCDSEERRSEGRGGCSASDHHRGGKCESSGSDGSNQRSGDETVRSAETALAELGEDATDKETRDAHRAVERAAANLIQVLQANDGTADQIEAATMKRDSAKTMADALTSPIEIADQRQAITDALADVATAVAAVDDDSTDAEVKAADDAIAAARKAIEDATELPEAERTAHGLVVDVHATALAAAKTSRTAAIAAKNEEQRKAAAAVVTKAAGTKLKAMNAEAGRTAADEGLGGHLMTAADGTVAYTQTISARPHRHGGEGHGSRQG